MFSEVRLVSRRRPGGHIDENTSVPFDLTGLPCRFYPREQGWHAVMAWFEKGTVPPEDRDRASRQFVFQVVFIEPDERY